MKSTEKTQSREAEFTKKLLSAEKAVTPLGEKNETCNDHGGYTSLGTNYFGIKDIWSKCPACEKIREEKEEVGKRQRQAEARMAEFRRRLGLVGVPSRFADCSFDTYKCDTDGQTKALEVCREFAENFSHYKHHGDGLALLGQVGNGKTHLAISVLKKVMLNHTAIYTTVGDLIRSVRATWQNGLQQIEIGQTEEQVLALYHKVDLLIIDEVGVQTGSDNEQQILFGILNRRYNEKKSTIFLSNCPARTYMEGTVQVLGVKEYLGERTFDRLTQVSHVINFNWDSYRKLARKEWQESSR